MGYYYGSSSIGKGAIVVVTVDHPFAVDCVNTKGIVGIVLDTDTYTYDVKDMNGDTWCYGAEEIRYATDTEIAEALGKMIKRRR